MAEILGVVSGTVGIAGSAIQILDSICKLRVFCSKIKHANARLEDLLNEVHFLASLVVDLGELEATDASFNPRGVAQLAGENCRRASDVVAQVLFNVEAKLSRTEHSGHLSSLKLVIQENDIQDNLNRLERAKSMLLIAQHCLTRLQLQQIQMHQSQRFEAMERLLKPTPTYASATSAHVNTNEDVFSKPGVLHSSHWIFLGFLIIIYSDYGANGKRLRILPAAYSWWLWGMDVVQTRAFGRPQFLFRTFRIISRESPIWIACALGDETEVLRLFSNRLASPHDTIEEGSTLLHISAAFHRAKICKLLLGYGVDAACRNSIELSEYVEAETCITTYTRTPLQMASSLITIDPDVGSSMLRSEAASCYEMSALSHFEELRQYEPKSDDVLDTIKTLVDDGGLNPLDSDSDAVYCYTLPFRDPMLYMLKYAEYADVEDVWSSAFILFLRAVICHRPEGIDFALQLFEAALSLLEIQNCGDIVDDAMLYYISAVNFSILCWEHGELCSDQSHRLQRCINRLLQIPGASLMHDEACTRFYGLPLFERDGGDVPMSLLWLTLLGFPVPPILHMPKGCLVCGISDSNHVCKDATYPSLLAEKETLLNYAVQIWLEILSNTNLDVRSYLEREKALYLRMPSWARTNLQWQREGNGSVTFFYPEVIVYEVNLQFTMDNPDLAPLVKVTIQDDSIDSIKAEIEAALKEYPAGPGAWID